MSTNYYHLREPVTAIKVDETELGFRNVWITIGDYDAGYLHLKEEDVSALLLLLGDQAYDDQVPVRTTFGGKGAGLLVHERYRGLNPALQLISEYGDLTTLAEVRKLAGAGRGE